MNPRAIQEHDEAAYPESAKIIYKAPQDMPNCLDLQCLTTTETSTSFWKPTEEELAALANGSSIELTIWGGHHPPVSLTVTDYV